MKRHSGFTIVELLAVIVILTVLSAIAYPWYLSQKDKALYAEAKSIARNMIPLVRAYEAETGKFPPDETNDVPPAPVESVWTYRAAMPFASSMDYDHHGIGGGWCIAQFTFFGKNQGRDTTPGSRIAAGDDLLILIQEYDCDAIGPVTD